MIADYVNALCKEIEQSQPTESVKTIYFGGGTPSLLTVNQFRTIFDSLNKSFNLKNCEEVTVEVNPKTVDESFLIALKNLGVNRLSIGIQSFNDVLLHTLGRIHNSFDAEHTIELATNIFNNVSIDLMYDLPEQSTEILCRTIKQAIKFNVQHISIYGLEIEEATEFARLKSINQLNIPDDETSNDMYDLIFNELPKHNFIRYEISNFALKGFESQHNLGYWSDEIYFGFGPAAHSYNRKMRWSNVVDVKEYINKIKSNEETKLIEEVVTRDRAIEEFCFLSLRKTEGINKNHFAMKFNQSIESVYSKVINQLIQLNLLIETDTHIKLSQLGMKYGNQVFSEFLL